MQPQRRIIYLSQFAFVLRLILLSMAMNNGALLAQDVSIRAELITRAVTVTLNNESSRSYAFLMGGVFGPYTWPGFQFTIEGLGQLDGQVYVASNGPGLIAGKADPWVVPVPSGGSLKLNFSLSKLYLRKQYRTSLNDVLGKRWRLTVVYDGHSDAEYYALWGKPMLTFPFWTGQLKSSIANTAVTNK